MSRMQRTGWLSAAWSTVVLALAVGCGNNNGLPSNPGIQQHPLVQGFSQCSDLQKYVQDTATLQMRAELTAARDNRWGGGVMAYDAAETPTAGASGAPSTASGPSAYTTTNNQVAGVDESDFVKNDGTRIFLLSGDTLYLNRSWPADQLQTVGSLKIEGWPRDMALDGNQVTVFSQIYLPTPGMVPYGGGAVGGGVAAPAMCTPFMCGFWYGDHTKITVIDVTDMANPRVISELYEPGYYNDSRRIDHTVRMVASDQFRWPSDVKWWPDSLTDWNDAGKRRAAYDALMDANEKIIRATPVTKWLPVAYQKDASGTLVAQPMDCSQYHRSNAPNRLGLVSVTTVDLSNAASPNITRTSLIAEPGQVYASQSSLYIASAHWWWWDAPGQMDWTYVHKFDLTDPTVTTYVGSGGVAGTPINQFSFDEQGDTLHVATTIHNRVYDPFNQWGRVETTNRVSALAMKDGWLQLAGQSPEVEKGESIYSVRFVGNTAYVSTFHSVDPLMVFDLSDPNNIRQLGSLEVSGFSTYLHPIDDTHLLAIGEDVQSSGSGGTVSSGGSTLQLSIFDVSDPAHPTRSFVQTVGSVNGGWSDALWDHKAFNYFPEKKLLAIPFVSWTYDPNSYWSSFTSELRVFSIDPATGFTPRGALSMKDVYQQVGDSNWVWYYTPNIRRSVMADDFVYAIADSGIRSANIADLSTPLATVLFNPYQDQ